MRRRPGTRWLLPIGGALLALATGTVIIVAPTAQASIPFDIRLNGRRCASL